jgi:hypothetical protein
MKNKPLALAYQARLHQLKASKLFFIKSPCPLVFSLRLITI